MKRAVVAVVLFAAFCMALPVASPQTAAPKTGARERPMSADETAMRQVSEDWIRYYNAGDAAKVAALYTDDGNYLSAHILAGCRVPPVPRLWGPGTTERLDTVDL
jgi:hypothetical protein